MNGCMICFNKKCSCKYQKGFLSAELMMFFILLISLSLTASIAYRAGIRSQISAALEIRSSLDECRFMLSKETRRADGNLKALCEMDAHLSPLCLVTK